ncbi:MAG TPA: hemolysin family protein [Candidatus Sulfomarinibacteraceae bacterium]|nr:hemolysin family protein [Candidatus Sulfomarinibacteraceae bacterium]
MSNVTFEIAVILLLILFNGVFAMSEIAVVSARRARLEQMARQGNHGARAALDLVETPNRFLSTVQVGITLVGIFAGAFGGATIAAPLAELLRELPLIDRWAGAISLFLVVGVITYLSVVIGELVPKRIALQSAERIASLVARPMRALSVLATPIVRLLSLSTDGVLALMGIKASPEEAVTEEEIKVLVEQSAQAGVIEEAERDMVESIFLLGDRPLEAMMTPRPEIVWLDINESPQKIQEIIETSTHSRFPVCDGDLDNVLGVVRSKSLLDGCLGQRPLNLRELMQEPLFVPETVRALKALERFKQTGMHMALLVDEYGGIEGLVTLIDILEAIVGDIPTLDEIVEPPIVQREDGSWLVDGLLSVHDFQEAFDVTMMPGAGQYQTMGGFMVYMIGSVPRTSEYFGWGGFRFEVADMDGHRVDKILVEKAPDEEGDDEEDPTRE